MAADLYVLEDPGKNDGRMTMNYHGIPWTTMIVHGHTTMKTMDEHILLNGSMVALEILNFVDGH